MKHACSQPVGYERLVAYWANDLPDDDVAAIDDQLFACDACSAESGRISRATAMSSLMGRRSAAASRPSRRASGVEALSVASCW